MTVQDGEREGDKEKGVTIKRCFVIWCQLGRDSLVNCQNKTLGIPSHSVTYVYSRLTIEWHSVPQQARLKDTVPEMFS